MAEKKKNKKEKSEVGKVDWYPIPEHLREAWDELEAREAAEAAAAGDAGEAEDEAEDEAAD